MRALLLLAAVAVLLAGCGTTGAGSAHAPGAVETGPRQALRPVLRLARRGLAEATARRRPLARRLRRTLEQLEALQQAATSAAATLHAALSPGETSV